MTRSRLILIGIAAVVLGLAGAWLAGRSGRSEAEQAATEARMLLEIQTGRARVLEARIALYNINFGMASQELERAKSMFERARDRLNATNRTADAGVISRAIGLINDAQKMAGSLDQGANQKAAEALDALRPLNLPDPERPLAR